MPKRKIIYIDLTVPKRNKMTYNAWLWHRRCPKPVWPPASEPHLWSAEDIRSALSINTMCIEAKNHDNYFKPRKEKVSQLAQALDLAGFDDFEIVIWLSKWVEEDYSGIACFATFNVQKM